MKNKSILLLCAILPLLTLNSCIKQETIQTKIDKDFKNQLSIMKKKNGEESYQAYLKANLYLDDLYQTIDELMENASNYIIRDEFNKLSKEANNSYWENHDQLIITLKEVLQNQNNYDYYAENIDDVDYYRDFDTSKLFHSTNYQAVNGETIEQDFQSLTQKIKDNSISFDNLCIDFEKIDQSLSSLMDIYKLNSIYQDLYVEDKKYIDINNKYSGYYQKCTNSYEELIKTILNSSFKDQFIKEYNMTDEQVNSYINKVTYSDEILDLFEQETNLENEFSSKFNIGDEGYNYKESYLNLVTVRRNIAQKLGYSNYLEYVWSDYGRDYSIEDAKTLTSNILNNKDIETLYEKFASLSSMYYQSLSSYHINESMIFDTLELTKQISPYCVSAIRDLKNYGNYNFEARSNKYIGSYVTNYNSKDDYFIFVSASDNAFSLPSIVHEFGHYLGLTRYDKSKKGNLFSLDICEVHSQGLEYLMNNYYYQIMDDRIANRLVDYQIFNALWTFLSGSAVAELEYYVYTTSDKLTISQIDKEFASIVAPLKKYGFRYEEVPHIYSSPGYYISYVVSILPALQLWSMDLNLAIDAYNEIISYGESNGFSYVLDQAGLVSPFKEEVLRGIIEKIKQIQ